MRADVKKAMQLAALLAVPLLGAGCGRVCTEIGCQDQLLVEVRDAAGAPVTAFSGEARFEERTITFQCDAEHTGDAQNYLCVSGGVQLLAAPQTLELSVADTAPTPARFEASLSPTYTRWRPNGEDCPPVCQQATVTAVLE